MRSRTYRYFNGEVLYPFGYGLSYTTFKYSKIKVPQRVVTGQIYKVTAQVQNTGNKAGDEVVQLYVKHLDKGIRKPIVALKGFKRIYFKAGEIKAVSFNISPESLSLVDKNNKQTERAGISQIFIGGAQPDHQGNLATNIIAGKVIVKGAVYTIK
jgi:beta-glucosidase